MSKSGDTDSEDKIGKSSFILFFYRVNENLITCFKWTSPLGQIVAGLKLMFCLTLTLFDVGGVKG